MKKYKSILILIIAVFVFGACDFLGDDDNSYDNNTSTNDDNNSDTGKTFGDFGITLETYEDSSSWDQVVNDVFGSGYRVADWNDLVAFYNAGGDLLALYDGLGLTAVGNSAFVERSGDPSYSTDRYYFASRHEHNKPESYLAHENIDNYLISLGSWSGSRKIMSVKVTY